MLTKVNNNYIISKVLSSTVSNAMMVYIGDEASETAKFIDMIDKFFDTMNVNNYSSCYKQLKQFKSPYRWSNDARIKVK